MRESCNPRICQNVDIVQKFTCAEISTFTVVENLWCRHVSSVATQKRFTLQNHTIDVRFDSFLGPALHHKWCGWLDFSFQWLVGSSKTFLILILSQEYKTVSCLVWKINNIFYHITGTTNLMNLHSKGSSAYYRPQLNLQKYILMNVFQLFISHILIPPTCSVDLL